MKPSGQTSPEGSSKQHREDNQKGGSAKWGKQDFVNKYLQEREQPSDQASSNEEHADVTSRQPIPSGVKKFRGANLAGL